MKSCYCPNCGTKQQVRLEISSKVAVPCPNCGRSLLVKRDPKSITVTVKDPAGIEPTVTVKATEPARAAAGKCSTA